MTLIKKLLLLLTILCTTLFLVATPVSYADDDLPADRQEESGGTTWETNPNVPCPPFGGGPITGEYGEWRDGSNGTSPHQHAGLDIGIDDAEIRAPVDGMVYHKDAMEDSFGEGIAYFVSDDGAYRTKIRLLFADLDSRTAQMPSKQHVKKGEVIGYVSGWVKPSTGAHIHVQYYDRDPADPHAPYLGFESGCMDPGPILRELGVDLSGRSYSGPNGGRIGGDEDNGFAEKFWTVEAMKELGTVFADIIHFWTQNAIRAVQSIFPYVYYLLLLFCVLDLTIPILLSGMSVKFSSLIIKVLKYSGIMAVIVYWPRVLNDFLISFVTSIGGIVASSNPELTTDLTQPHILFLKAASLIQPAMQKVGAFGWYDYFNNLGQVILLYLMVFLVLGVFLFVAIKITLVYIEFYVFGAMSLVTVPFGSWSMSKFVAEGPLGALVSSALKILVISIMVGMCTIAIRDAHVNNIFDPSPITTSAPQKPAASDKSDTNPDENPKGDPKDSSSEETPDGKYVLKGSGKTIYTNNYLCKKIWDRAKDFGIDPYIALAIAARESGGDDIEAIHMDDDPKSAGIFQVTEGQSIQDPNTNETIYIEGLFPDYRTDEDQNIDAGLTILKDKIRGADGNIWLGVKNYNGSPQKEQYLQMVQKNYTALSGFPAGHIGNTGISAESLAKFGFICTVLIIMALMILIIPEKVIGQVKGPLQLGGQ